MFRFEMHFFPSETFIKTSWLTFFFLIGQELPRDTSWWDAAVPLNGWTRCILELLLFFCVVFEPDHHICYYVHLTFFYLRIKKCVDKLIYFFKSVDVISWRTRITEKAKKTNLKYGVNRKGQKNKLKIRGELREKFNELL